jgi:micrococcal nuclease
MIWLLLACVPDAHDGSPDAEGEETGAPPDTDTPGVDDDEDDAYVRSLTGLPEGDVACSEPMLVRVEEAVDGDTFHALPEGETWWFSVRMIGIDTPEIEHEDPAECYGDEAFAWTASQLDGKLVWLTFDEECEDAYDRTLAYVFRDDTEAGFVNRALARNGFAEQMTFRPNDTFADLIGQDVAAAQREDLGMWGVCAR